MHPTRRVGNSWWCGCSCLAHQGLCICIIRERPSRLDLIVNCARTLLKHQLSTSCLDSYLFTVVSYLFTISSDGCWRIAWQVVRTTREPIGTAPEWKYWLQEESFDENTWVGWRKKSSILWQWQMFVLAETLGMPEDVIVRKGTHWLRLEQNQPARSPGTY